MRTRFFAVTLLVCFTGCKDEPGSLDKVNEQKKVAEAQSGPRSTVVRTPVPYGVKLPCTQLLDPAKFGAAIGKEITVKDSSASDADATAVCGIRLAGTPPTAKEQEKKWMENNRVLGVLPGDEICQVTAYCGFIFEVAEQRKKCETEGQKVSQEIGDLTCVRTVQAGPDDRYIFSVLDPDTRCRILVNPGPSVVDEVTPKLCARAAVDQITMEQLKTP